MSFNDWQSSHRPSSEILVHFSRSFKQARVQIKDVSGVSFSARRSSQKQRHLPIGNCLLGKVVVDDESVLAVVAEELCDGTAGVGRQKLQGSSLGGSSSDHDGVFECVMEFEGLDNVGDSGPFLTDCHIDAEQLLVHISGVEVGFLVYDGVDGDCGFAGLPVTDNELALASADGHQGVDGLEPGLHGLVYGLSRNNAGSFDLHSLPFGSFDRTQPVNGVAQSIEDSAQHLLSYGHVHDGSCPLYAVPLHYLSAWRQCYLSLPKMTTPTLSLSRLRAIPRMPDLNSTIYPACTLLRPTTRAMPSPMLMTVPYSRMSSWVVGGVRVG